MFFFKNGPTSASFRLFRIFKQTYNFPTNICEKMFIQYTAPGLEPMTFEHESCPITARPGLPLVPFLEAMANKVQNLTLIGKSEDGVLEI